MSRLLPSQDTLHKNTHYSAFGGSSAQHWSRILRAVDERTWFSGPMPNLTCSDRLPTLGWHQLLPGKQHTGPPQTLVLVHSQMPLPHSAY